MMIYALFFILLLLFFGLRWRMIVQLRALSVRHDYFLKQLKSELLRRRKLIPRFLLERKAVEIPQENQKNASRFMDQLLAAQHQATVVAEAEEKVPSRQVPLMHHAEQHMMHALVDYIEAVPLPKVASVAFEPERLITEEILSMENRVSFARDAYNDAVMHYNTERISVWARLFWLQDQFMAFSYMDAFEAKVYQRLQSRQTAWQSLASKKI